MKTLIRLLLGEQSDLGLQTVKTLQTMKTLIRLLIEEQFDLGLHCLPKPMSENLGSLG